MLNRVSRPILAGLFLITVTVGLPAAEQLAVPPIPTRPYLPGAGLLMPPGR